MFLIIKMISFYVLYGIILKCKCNGGIVVNERKKIMKKRVLWAIVVGIMLISFVGLIFGRKNTPFEQVLKETFQSIEYYCVKRPLQYFDDLKDEYISMRKVYEENKGLRAALEDYAVVSSQNEALKKEIEALKEMSELSNIPTDFKGKVASVISRDVESWNNKLMINLGDINGIKEGMVVITGEGMIGRVSSVSELTSSVTLLTSENNATQVPIMIQKKGSEEYAYGMLKGYNIKEKSFEIDMIDQAEIEVGATILTSGLGGVSPRGIVVGKVESSIIPDDQILLKVYGTPSNSFESIHYVTVLQRSDQSE